MLPVSVCSEGGDETWWASMEDFRGVGGQAEMVQGLALYSSASNTVQKTLGTFIFFRVQRRFPLSTRSFLSLLSVGQLSTDCRMTF